MRHEEDGMYHVGLREQMSRADLWTNRRGRRAPCLGLPRRRPGAG